MLIAFARTSHGRKLIAMLPQLGIAAAVPEDPWATTMADMRTVAAAVEALATDTNEYPKVDFDALPAVIEPVYIWKAPRLDAWGTPFVYVSDGQRYRIVSAGADRFFEWNARQLEDDPAALRA